MVLLLLLFVPLIADAQGDVQGLLINLLSFLNGSVVPALFALAFLFFLYNALRYFIVGAADEEARKKARRLASYGIVAFVLMVSIWGIVNLLVGGLGFNNSSAVCPDAIPDCNFMLESESGFFGDMVP